MQTESFNDIIKTPVNESSIESTSEEKNLVEMGCDMWSSADFGPYRPKCHVFSQTHRVSADCK